MRDEVISRVEHNLKTQLAVYSELREMAVLKQQALVSNKIKELDALVTSEEVLIMQTARLEEERLELAQAIAEDLGVPMEEVTLSRLAVSYPQFSALQNQIEELILEIQDKNALNTELINQAMSIVEFSLNLLTRQQEQTYSRSVNKRDKGKQKAKSAFIIDKTV